MLHPGRRLSNLLDCGDEQTDPVEQPGVVAERAQVILHAENALDLLVTWLGHAAGQVVGTHPVHGRGAPAKDDPSHAQFRDPPPPSSRS